MRRLIKRFGEKLFGPRLSGQSENTAGIALLLFIATSYLVAVPQKATEGDLILQDEMSGPVKN